MPSCLPFIARFSPGPLQIGIPGERSLLAGVIPNPAILGPHSGHWQCPAHPVRHLIPASAVPS